MVLIAKTGSMSSAPIEMKSDRPCSHQQESEMLKIENSELKAKVASLEKEKEEGNSNNGKTLNQISKERDIIASLIPRNLPQYRSDEDFEKEVELRVSQLSEYCTIQDIKDLMDAKIWKHAKNLAAKTASMERRDSLDLVQNALHGIVGNNKLVYGKGSRDNRRIPAYDPIANHYYPNHRRGRTASLGNDSFWFLDLFTSQQ